MKTLALFRLNEYNFISFQNLKYRFEVSQVSGHITVQEAAEKWGVTPRQVQILCKENRIVGAMRMSRIWIIPENQPQRQVQERFRDYIKITSRNLNECDSN